MLLSQGVISWNKDNIPSIYEVLSVGVPYIENDGGSTSMESKKAGDELNVLYSADNLNILTANSIRSICISDISGRQILQKKVNGNSFCIATSTLPNQLLLLTVYLEQGDILVRKMMVR